MVEDLGDLTTQCARLFSPQGRLSTALPGFIAREAQINLAIAIAECITKKGILVAEAGTGTGKTFAYLVPCLVSGKKTIISTATKTLQDQLFLKDLPGLLRALGISCKLQNLKGRANYLCRHRIQLHTEEGRFSHPQAAHDLMLLNKRIGQLQVGERAELPEIAEESPVWPYATSTTDNCLGGKCEHHKNCFLIKARKKAIEADVVVINHHLFFADSQLKEEGFAELLPGVEVVIFDEAHQIVDIAANFNSERISTKQLKNSIDDLILEWPIIDLPNQPFKQLQMEMDILLSALQVSIGTNDDRIPWEQVVRRMPFKETWQQLLSLVAKIHEAIAEPQAEEKPGVSQCRQRLANFLDFARRFSQPNPQIIQWIEQYKHSLILHATPVDVADSFSALLQKQKAATIFTSATLTMASSFDSFLRPLGLKQVDTLLLPSPFNYQRQALLYLPRYLPDPKSVDYYPMLVSRVLPIINALRGRCFFLFTSHRALKVVAQMLVKQLNYPLLVQGDESKSILLARFRQLGNAVLLGTATFWEGVDVKGEALSCVIIDKLPFASPQDPVVRGKMAYLKTKGLSGFDELSLPDAVLALKQGMGRLIRDVNDRGIFVIADPRLTGREYGRDIFASLPPLAKTRSETTVLNFIKEMALSDEIISD